MGKKTEFEKALFLNNSTAIDYLNRLRLLATSLFKWKNLDKICGFGAERFLEQSLYTYGRACFVKDNEIGFHIFNANPSDKLNSYYLPTKIMAWSLGYSKNFDLDDVVYIMNNNLILPTKNTIVLFANRLYETERTIDTNLNAQKTPILIEGDVKQSLTLENLYMKYSGNIPFIFGNKDFQINGKLNVIKTDSPYLIDKLTIHKHELWNDCLTYLGIDNANTDKKERLVTSEVESNNDLITYYLNCFYSTRKIACDMINEMLEKSGEELRVSLEINKNVLKEMEDIEDGEIYDNNLFFSGE